MTAGLPDQRFHHRQQSVADTPFWTELRLIHYGCALRCVAWREI